MSNDFEFDGISEEEANGQIFKQGQSILIETEDSVLAGAFVGLSDFGLIYRATHKMVDIEWEPEPQSLLDLRADLETKTIAQIKEEAAELGVTFSGCKVKKDYVDAYLEFLVEQAIEQKSGKQMVELKRTIMTFLTWSQILKIEATTEWLEEQNLSDFSDELAVFPGLSLEDPDIAQSSSQGSDE